MALCFLPTALFADAAKEYAAVTHALPLPVILDALQLEPAASVLCLAVTGQPPLSSAADAVAEGLLAALQNQPGIASVNVLEGLCADDTEARGKARAAQCSHLLVVTAFPADGSSSLPKVLLALGDLDGDQLVLTASTAYLAAVTEGRVPSLEGPMGELNVRYHADAEKLAQFRKRALRLTGTELYGWSPVIITHDGVRLPVERLREFTDDPMVLRRAAAYREAEHARAEALKRLYLVGLIGVLPAVIPAAAVGGIAGALALSAAATGGPAGLAISIGLGLAAGAVAFVLFGAFGGAVVAIGARVVGSFVVPKPDEALTLEEARWFVVEANVRTGRSLGIDVEDIPSRYLPTPRVPPRKLIKKRLRKLELLLDTAPEKEAVEVEEEP